MLHCCPECAATPTDIISHIRDVHPTRQWSALELEGTGLTACVCGAVCSANGGLKSHQGKVKCIGWSGSSRRFEPTPTPAPVDKKNVTVVSDSEDSSSAYNSSYSSESDYKLKVGTFKRVARLRPTASKKTKSKRILLGKSIAKVDEDTIIPSQPPFRPSSPVPLNSLSTPLIGPSLSPSPTSFESSFVHLALLPAPVKPLGIQYHNVFKETVRRLSQCYVNDPRSETALYDILALPKVGLAPGLKVNTHKRLQQYPRVEIPAVPTDFTPYSNTSTLKRISQQVCNNKLGRAARLLGDQLAIAEVTPVVIDILRDKHPDGQPKTFGAKHGCLPGITPDSTNILAAFETIKPETGTGVSGWSQPLLAIALREPLFLEFLTIFTRQICQGVAPLRRLFCASRLTPLKKPDGGIRPIAVGELIYRLSMKVILRHFSKPSMLLKNQFGVGSPGGVEPVIYAIEKALDGTLPKRYAHLVSLDFSNAFNTLNRSSLASAINSYAPTLLKTARWAYNEPSPLIIADKGEITIIESSEGVRQGDPMGPLFFSLGIRQAVHELQISLGPDTQVLAYLDDIYILCNSDNTLELAVKFFSNRRPEGLQLNASKSKIVSLEDIKSDGFEILGTMVGSPVARRLFLHQLVQQQSYCVNKLPGLPFQDALLLLKQCIQQNLRYLMRSLKTDDIPDLWEDLDKILVGSLLLLRGSPRRLDTDFDLITLPTKLGGCGILSFKECAPHARAAMEQASNNTLSTIFTFSGPAEVIKQSVRCGRVLLARQESLIASLSPASARAVIDHSSKLARMWMNVTPTNLTLELSDQEISSALHHRTLCPGHEVTCACGLPNDTGHDETCQGVKNWRLARHEMIKKIIIKSVKSNIETTVTTEPGCTIGKQRTDFRITGPCSVSGGASEYDITVASTYSAKASALFSKNTTKAAVSEKSAVQRAATELGLHLQNRADLKNSTYTGITATPFIPLVMTPAGTLHPTAIKCMQHWRSKVAGYRYMEWSLSFTLVRTAARWFVM